MGKKHKFGSKISAQKYTPYLAVCSSHIMFWCYPFHCSMILTSITIHMQKGIKWRQKQNGSSVFLQKRQNLSAFNVVFPSIMPQKASGHRIKSHHLFRIWCILSGEKVCTKARESIHAAHARCSKVEDYSCFHVRKLSASFHQLPPSP